MVTVARRLQKGLSEKNQTSNWINAGFFDRLSDNGIARGNVAGGRMMSRKLSWPIYNKSKQQAEELGRQCCSCTKNCNPIMMSAESKCAFIILSLGDF